MPSSRKRQRSVKSDQHSTSVRSDKRRKQNPCTKDIEGAGATVDSSLLANPVPKPTPSTLVPARCSCGKCICGMISPRMWFSAILHAKYLHKEGRMFERANFTPRDGVEREIYEAFFTEGSPTHVNSQERVLHVDEYLRLASASNDRSMGIRVSSWKGDYVLIQMLAYDVLCAVFSTSEPMTGTVITALRGLVQVAVWRAARHPNAGAGPPLILSNHPELGLRDVGAESFRTQRDGLVACANDDRLDLIYFGLLQQIQLWYSAIVHKAEESGDPMLTGDGDHQKNGADD